MIASPFSRASATSCTELSVISPAGTITQTERGGVELLGHLLQRADAGGALVGQVLDRVGADVVDDAIVSVLHQAAHDVRSHPPQSDHSELCHCLSSSDACLPLNPKWGPRRGAADTVRHVASHLAGGKAHGPAADALVIFGITGDLAKKMTYDALYRPGDARHPEGPGHRRRHRRAHEGGPAQSGCGSPSRRPRRTSTRRSSRASPSASPTSRATTRTRRPSRRSQRS